MDRNMQTCYTQGVGAGTNACYDTAKQICYYESIGVTSQLFGDPFGCLEGPAGGMGCYDMTIEQIDSIKTKQDMILQLEILQSYNGTHNNYTNNKQEEVFVNSHKKYLLDLKNHMED